MMAASLPRGHGDIETAVVTLVDHLVPVVPVRRQPYLARKIAEVIASMPSSMGNNMFLRQSIIRRGTATHDHVIDGLAAWVTVLFDLGNLRYNRSRALELKATILDEALARLTHAFRGHAMAASLRFPTQEVSNCSWRISKTVVSMSASSIRSATSQRLPNDGSFKVEVPLGPHRLPSSE
jgi:hypothetical protein